MYGHINGQVPAFRFSLYIRITRSILSAVAAAAGRTKLAVKFSVKNSKNRQRLFTLTPPEMILARNIIHPRHGRNSKPHRSLIKIPQITALYMRAALKSLFNCPILGYTKLGKEYKFAIFLFRLFITNLRYAIMLTHKSRGWVL